MLPLELYFTLLLLLPYMYQWDLSNQLGTEGFDASMEDILDVFSMDKA